MIERIVGLVLVVVAIIAVFSAQKSDFGFSNIFESTAQRSVIKDGRNSSGNSDVIVTPKKKLPEQRGLVKSVRITTVGGGYGGGFSEIALVGDSETPVVLDGWKLRSESDIIVIPKAVEYYRGSVGGEKNITLRKGDRVSLYSNSGAIFGGFRVNKCMGYLTKAYNFIPSFYAGCPAVQERITQQKLGEFSSTCIAYVRSLSSCDTPPADPPVPVFDYACRQFLRTLNYDTCVERFGNDGNFLSNDWKVWLGGVTGGSRNIVNSRHDKIQLIAGDGTIVDEYIY